jgi:hypothetical protein
MFVVAVKITSSHSLRPARVFAGAAGGAVSVDADEGWDTGLSSLLTGLWR